MLFMFLTFAVLNAETSNEVRAPQPWNMYFMFTTLLVSKDETSNEVRLRQ